MTVLLRLNDGRCYCPTKVQNEGGWILKIVLLGVSAKSSRLPGLQTVTSQTSQGVGRTGHGSRLQRQLFSTKSRHRFPVKE